MMKKNKLFLASICILGSSLFFTSCKKDNKSIGIVETYKLLGKLDASRTTIATAAITKAEFTVSYNNGNSFGDAQSIVNGNLALTGYTGITGRDSIVFFATQPNGPATSFITVATTAVSTTTSTIYYKYFNGSAATFDLLNFPFTNDVTAALKEGKGYFRIGQSPKYVFVLLDNVTKL